MTAARHLDSVADFERELAAFGLALKGGAICDGKIHRVDDVHHRRKGNGAGWYILRDLPSGLLYGKAGSWLGDRGSFDWNNRGSTKYTAADRAAIAKAKADQAAEAKRLHRQAADAATSEWAKAKPCTTHPYLDRKDVPSYGLRVDGSGRLLVPVTDLDGNLHGLQRIDAEGGKRFTFGTDRSGAALAFIIGEIDDAAAVVIVEGYATGATLHQATGLPVVVAFDANGLKRIAPLLRGRLSAAILIFAGDHDPEAKGGTGQKAARFAAVTAGGVAVLPPIEGDDWNDHASVHGLEDVRRQIIKAAGLHHHLPATVTLREGTTQIDAAISQFMAEGAAWRGLPDDQRETEPPPASLINATMGSGKSHNVRHVAGDFLKAAPGSAVSTFVPLHRLATEQAESFQKETGLEASIWRGMEQQDPTRPEGDLMCLVPVLSTAARDASVSVSEVCKVCPMRNECGYRRQRQQSGRYWLLPHQMMFTDRPSTIQAPAFAVIDEAFHSAGMAENVRLAVSTIEGDLSDVPHAGDRDLLQAARNALLSTIAALMPTKGRAYLTRAALETAGISAATAREAARIEWTRKPKPRLDGDIPHMVAELEALAGRFSPKVPMLWRLVSDFLEADHDRTPGVEIEANAQLRGGDGFGTLLRLHYRRDVHASWRAPTLILDGTARPEIVRHFFPHLGTTSLIDIEAPHQTVTWVRRSFAKYRLEPSKPRAPGSPAGKWQPASPETAARRDRTAANTLEEVRRYIEAVASRYRGQARHDSPDVVVFCNQGVEALLRAGRLPANVVIDHFNNTRGRNDWAHVRAVIVIGRPLPSPATIHQQAERMAGRPLDPADPLVADVRWSICEAELMQVIARPRGVRRTASNPLNVYLLGDTALPLQIDQVLPWAEAQPHPLELMAARGVVPACDPDQPGYWPLVAAVLPDLFPTVQAAKDANRAHSGNRLIDISSLDVSHCEPAKAKPYGARYAVPVLIDPASRDGLPLEILPPDSRVAPQVRPEKVDRPATCRDAAMPTRGPPSGSVTVTASAEHRVDAIAGAMLGKARRSPLADPLPPTVAHILTLPDEWAGYDGGLMPSNVAAFVRMMQRAGGISQERLASRMDLSRPQLANALAGRFGLSRDAADRLRSTLAELPQAQGDLL